MSEWKPISEAPKDDTRILICGVGYMKYPCVAYWKKVMGKNKKGEEFIKREGWYNGRADYWHTSPATHWQPCPELPQPPISEDI
jgi:hypothetical protein